MKTWVRRSLNVGAFTAGAVLASGAAAHASGSVSVDGADVLNGTSVNVPIQAPINVCGNAISVLGSATAGCRGGAAAVQPEWTFEHFLGGTTEDGSLISANGLNALNDTSANVPIQAPINVCGNAVAVLGDATAGCQGGAEAGNGNGPNNPYENAGVAHPEALALTETLVSADNLNLLNGTRVNVPVQVPIDICGNAISVLGTASASCGGGSTANG